MAIVRVCDIHAAEFCNHGAREFFEYYGINWADFIQNGIDSSPYEHLDDVYIHRVIEIAKERERKEKWAAAAVNNKVK